MNEKFTVDLDAVEVDYFYYTFRGHGYSTPNLNGIDVNLLTDDEKQVLENPHTIRDMEEQTEIMAILAVSQYGLLLEDVKEQTPYICLEAVKQNPFAIEYVEDQHPTLCMFAVRQNGDALEYIKNKTPEICRAAVENSWDALAFVKEPTPELCNYAFKTNVKALRYIENQTEEMCLEAAKKDPDALLYIINPSEEVQIAAVQTFGTPIQYIDNPSLELCLDAIRRDKMSMALIPQDRVNEIVNQTLKRAEMLYPPDIQKKHETNSYENLKFALDKEDYTVNNKYSSYESMQFYENRQNTSALDDIIASTRERYDSQMSNSPHRNPNMQER